MKPEKDEAWGEFEKAVKQLVRTPPMPRKGGSKLAISPKGRSSKKKEKRGTERE